MAKNRLWGYTFNVMKTAPRALRWVGKMALAVVGVTAILIAAILGVLQFLTSFGLRAPPVPKTRSWVARHLPSDGGPPPSPGQYPSDERRLDLAVMPRGDLFPAVWGDPETGPQIDRKMILGAEQDIRLPPNPFQPATRPVSSDDEALTTEELAEKIRKNAEDEKR